MVIWIFVCIINLILALPPVSVYNVAILDNSFIFKWKQLKPKVVLTFGPYRMFNELKDHERGRRQTTSYSTEEILAQALCQASTMGRGVKRVYAVGKSCGSSSGNCHYICSSQQLHNQDTQTARHRWSCISAFHVYYGRPTTSKNGNFNTARLGLKTLRESCAESGCGPNFCCCIAEASQSCTAIN